MGADTTHSHRRRRPQARIHNHVCTLAVSSASCGPTRHTCGRMCRRNHGLFPPPSLTRLGLQDFFCTFTPLTFHHLRTLCSLALSCHCISRTDALILQRNPTDTSKSPTTDSAYQILSIYLKHYQSNSIIMEDCCTIFENWRAARAAEEARDYAIAARLYRICDVVYECGEELLRR